MGGEARVAAHRARGRLTARERVALLVDDGTFVELGRLAISDNADVGERAPADAVITGIGAIAGRKVAVIANDATTLGGSTGTVAGRKQGQLMSIAARKGYPIVGLGDANGARLPDHLGSDFTEAGGNDEGEHFLGIRVADIRVPRVTAVLGNAYGDPTFWAAASDFVVMSDGCSLALSGPSLVGSSTGAATMHHDLGGPEMSARTTGPVSRLAESEADAVEQVRTFLGYLPSHAGLAAPVAPAAEPAVPVDSLGSVVPDRAKRGYDVRKVIAGVVDGGSFFELRTEFGRSLVVGLARAEGQPVASSRISPASRSASRRSGRRSRTGSSSCSPRLRVPVCRTDYVVAWPNSKIGFMSAENAVCVLHHKRLSAVQAAEGGPAAEALAEQMMKSVRSTFTPWRAAERALIHDVIQPEETREAVVNGLFIGTGYQ